KILAQAESLKKKSVPGYRSSSSVLRKLANSRLDLVLKRNGVRFDATDLSLAYANILKNKYNNNRREAEEQSFSNLVDILQVENYHEENLRFVLKNWCVLLLTNETGLRQNS